MNLTDEVRLSAMGPWTFEALYKASDWGAQNRYKWLSEAADIELTEGDKRTLLCIANGDYATAMCLVPLLKRVRAAKPQPKSARKSNRDKA